MIFVLFKSYTTGATYGTGTIYPSGAHELTQGFSVQCFALIVCPCNFFLLTIVLTVVLLLTTSNYTFGIFTFFLCFFFLNIIFPLLDFFLPIFVLPIFLRFTASDPKSTSCLSMVGGSLRVLRLLPPQKLVAMR